MARGDIVYTFEQDFLTQTASCPPLGEFRLYDGTRVTFFFSPRGLVMRIRCAKEEDTLKISREAIDDNGIRSIVFGSNEIKY